MRPRRETLYWVGTVIGLLALTTWLYGVHVFDAGRILDEPNHDWAQAVWFLAWPAYALRHGLDPLFSTWQNDPGGVNLMANTSMPLLGIVLAPVTWLLGPTVTYSIALRLGMVASACAAQWVARRLGLSRTASVLAGLLYAFSAMEIVEGNGHVFLTFAPIPPLLFYAVYRTVTGGLSPRRGGLLAGVALACQALISLELALFSVVTIVVGLCVAAVVCRASLMRATAVQVVAATGWFALACTVLLCVPMAVYFGRGHFWGPSHPTIEVYRANLESLVVPGRYTWLSPLGVHLPTTLAYKRENGAYLGLPVLAVLAAVAVKAWRVPLVRIATITLVVLGVLALGTQLNVTGASTHVPLPFAVLAKLPFLDSLSPVRAFVVIGLLVALLCAYGFDRLVAWARAPGAANPTSPLARTSLVVVCTVGVVASLLPAHTYASVPTDVPTWLDSPQGRALVPDGSVVLFYPYPSVASSQALLFQAVDGFRYKIVGGQGVVATSKPTVHAIVPLAPLAVGSVFLRDSTGALGKPPVKTIFGLPPLPPLDAATVRLFHEFVDDHAVTAIVAGALGTPGEARTARYLTAAFGAPVVVAGGTLAVWDRASLSVRHEGS